MEIDPTPPPYHQNSEVNPDEKSTEAISQTRDTEAGSSNEPNVQEVQEPHIVLYVSIQRNKSGKLTVFKSSRDAIMLSPSSTYKDTSKFLGERLANHKGLLQISPEAKLKVVLYYSIQDGGKDPWLDSNWHNNVRIFDEESWKACKALFARNDKSILMMLVYRTDDLDAGTDKNDKTDEGNLKAKKKSCVVQ